MKRNIMKIKDVIPQKREGVIDSVKVTIEEEGKEYAFAALISDFLGEETFPNLCRVWKREIKMKEEVAKMDEKVIKNKLKKFKGKVV